MMISTKAPIRLPGKGGSWREPETGYVEVRDEPRHYPRFENDYVRVYDVRFPPGEASLFHRHDVDTMYVTVNDARVYDETFQTGESQLHELHAGLSLCRPHGSEPLIHKVRNDGAGLMHMIGAEVKKLPPLVSDQPLAARCHTPLENLSGAERLRFYQLQLEPGESTGEISYGFSGLLVSLSDANIEFADSRAGTRVISFAPGSHIWHDGPVTQTVTNCGETAFVAILGEWC